MLPGTTNYTINELTTLSVTNTATDPDVPANNLRESILCAIAGLALLIASIGAALALLTGHARWIELAWLSIAASLLALVVARLWPTDFKRDSGA